MSITTLCVVLAATLVLAACTEKPQTATTRKIDQAPWQGPASPFTAGGWKPGDQASWDGEIRQRSQAQNEYVRITP